MMRGMTLCAFGTTTLGQLIDALSAAEPDAGVMFDFCYLAPTTVDSYRGYYDHLALGWKDATTAPYWPTATDLKAHLEQAVGRIYEGWKGGSYRMKRDTPLWVANPGHTGSTAITGIDVDGSYVILRTERVD